MGYERVFDRPGRSGEWDYYLEGGLRNLDTPIFALPTAMAALRNGQYFASHDANDFVLDRLVRSLKLRGVTGLNPTK